MITYFNLQSVCCSEFSDIFDVDHFKEALADDVRILSSLPSNHLMSRPVEEKHTPLHVSPQWIRARYLKRVTNFPQMLSNTLFVSLVWSIRLFTESSSQHRWFQDPKFLTKKHRTLLHLVIYEPFVDLSKWFNNSGIFCSFVDTDETRRRSFVAWFRLEALQRSSFWSPEAPMQGINGLYP